MGQCVSIATVCVSDLLIVSAIEKCHWPCAPQERAIVCVSALPLFAVLQAE